MRDKDNRKITQSKKSYNRKKLKRITYEGWIKKLEYNLFIF
jgi:hypothetical protein